MLSSVGSGIAQRLSPPATECHIPRGIGPETSSSDCFAMRLLLGPRVDGPSCRLPYTLYGIRLSVATWYICATGSWIWCQLLPRLIEKLRPSSCATTKRSPLVG